MHTHTIKIMRDLIDWLNVLHIEYFSNRNLGGSDAKEYQRFLKDLDNAKREVVKLRKDDEDEKKSGVLRSQKNAV
jgi:hypothetical protein